MIVVVLIDLDVVDNSVVTVVVKIVDKTPVEILSPVTSSLLS